MKYLVTGLVMAAVLIGGIISSGGSAYAGDEVRLKAFLSTLAVDPLRLNDADFRQRSDRMVFKTDVHDVAELGTGRVIVTRGSGILAPVILDVPIAIVLDPIRGTGVGHLQIDSRLGDSVPAMIAGDTVEVWNFAGQLVRTGTLQSK